MYNASFAEYVSNLLANILNFVYKKCFNMKKSTSFTGSKGSFFFNLWLASDLMGNHSVYETISQRSALCMVP